MARKINFLGIEIDSLTMAESVSKALDLVKGGGTHQHVVVNAAKIVSAMHDDSLKRTISDCAMVNADGQSIVWASRLLGQGLPERVAGIDFMDQMLRAAAAKSLSVYLLGASADVVSAVAEKVRDMGVSVVGFHDGFWRKDMSDEEMASIICDTQADLVFVALPSPFKENFLRDQLQRMNARLSIGVGGSFDVMAGVTSRAPKWMQTFGLEWLHRLLQEPRRMFMRYLVGNSRFIYYVVREFVTMKRRTFSK
ncbi:WecB/TagA/CpsF family glycosyltransferase [Arthrobacter globiformis]|uniref:WecB/TagA/CpsF family glycosyltransferase n=1 Tax=Arthrobacter globiformis TaxID=1665 RepID=UPI0027D83A0C|nr:WecB/TagA/CpsF family glycosyltransferase [Arthrobacter globiformis]